MKCVVVGCEIFFKVLRKAYDTYYIRKSQGKQPQRKRPPKWNLSAIQNHLRKVHSNVLNDSHIENNSSNDNDDSVSDVDNTSNGDDVGTDDGVENTTHSIVDNAHKNNNSTSDCVIGNTTNVSNSENNEDSSKDSGNAKDVDHLPLPPLLTQSSSGKFLHLNGF